MNYATAAALHLLMVTACAARESIPTSVYVALERGTSLISSDRHRDSLLLRVSSPSKAATGICEPRHGCCGDDHAFYVAGGAAEPPPYAEAAGLVNRRGQSIALQSWSGKRTDKLIHPRCCFWHVFMFQCLVCFAVARRMTYFCAGSRYCYAYYQPRDQAF